MSGYVEFQAGGRLAPTREAVYRELGSQLKSYAVALDALEPDDVTQDAFVRLLGKWDQIDTSRPLWPWLCRVVRNGIDTERRRGRPVVAFDEALGVIDLVAGPEEQAIRAEDLRRLGAAMRLLSPSDQRILKLRFWHDMSAHQIGQVVGATDVAARQRLSRAAQRLAARFKKLAEVLVPVLAGCAALIRSLRHHGPHVAAAGAASAVVAAFAVGVVVLLDMGPEEHVAGPPRTEEPAARLESVTSTQPTPEHPPTDPLGEPVVAAIVPNESAPPAPDVPEQDVPPLEPPRLRSSLDLNPGAEPGPKQSDEHEVDVLDGTLSAGGGVETTGSIDEVPCDGSPGSCLDPDEWELGGLRTEHTP